MFNLAGRLGVPARLTVYLPGLHVYLPGFRLRFTCQVHYLPVRLTTIAVLRTFQAAHADLAILARHGQVPDSSGSNNTTSALLRPTHSDNNSQTRAYHGVSLRLRLFLRASHLLLLVRGTRDTSRLRLRRETHLTPHATYEMFTPHSRGI